MFFHAPYQAVSYHSPSVFRPTHFHFAESISLTIVVDISVD
jgi:hypothetical protein